jgi:hypothetical protein
MKNYKFEVVINACYGGFGLSEEAKILFLEKLGYESKIIGKEGYSTIYIQEPPKKEHEKFFYKQKNNYVLEEMEIPRHNKALIEVVKTLRAKAEGTYSNLEIVTIDDFRYIITEYDGYESIKLPKSIKWEIIETPEIREEYPEYFI